MTEVTKSQLMGILESLELDDPRDIKPVTTIDIVKGSNFESLLSGLKGFASQQTEYLKTISTGQLKQKAEPKQSSSPETSAPNVEEEPKKNSVVKDAGLVAGTVAKGLLTGILGEYSKFLLPLLLMGKRDDSETPEKKPKVATPESPATASTVDTNQNSSETTLSPTTEFKSFPEKVIVDYTVDSNLGTTLLSMKEFAEKQTGYLKQIVDYNTELKNNAIRNSVQDATIANRTNLTANGGVALAGLGLSGTKGDDNAGGGGGSGVLGLAENVFGLMGAKYAWNKVRSVFGSLKQRLTGKPPVPVVETPKPPVVETKPTDPVVETKPTDPVVETKPSVVEPKPELKDWKVGEVRELPNGQTVKKIELPSGQSVFKDVKTGSFVSYENAAAAKPTIVEPTVPKTAPEVAAGGMGEAVATEKGLLKSGKGLLNVLDKAALPFTAFMTFWDMTSKENDDKNKLSAGVKSLGMGVTSILDLGKYVPILNQVPGVGDATENFSQLYDTAANSSIGSAAGDIMNETGERMGATQAYHSTIEPVFKWMHRMREINLKNEKSQNFGGNHEMFYGDSNMLLNKMMRNYTSDGEGGVLSPSAIEAKLAQSPTAPTKSIGSTQPPAPIIVTVPDKSSSAAPTITNNSTTHVNVTKDPADALMMRQMLTN